MPGEVVRPRWQGPDVPNLPPYGTDWVAVGITRKRPIGIYGATIHQNPEPGTDLMQRHEEFDLLCSFYGPNADVYSSSLHDGLMIWQNKSELRLVGPGELGIGVVVEDDLLGGALAFDLQPRRRERHREPAVERPTVLGAHLERQRGEVARPRVPDPEEVAEGGLDARLGLSVPPRAEDDLAQEVGLVALDCHPDVPDDAGLEPLGQHLPSAGRYVEPVVVAAAPVPARGANAARLGEERKLRKRAHR